MSAVLSYNGTLDRFGYAIVKLNFSTNLNGFAQTAVIGQADTVFGNIHDLEFQGPGVRFIDFVHDEDRPEFHWIGDAKRIAAVDGGQRSESVFSGGCIFSSALYQLIDAEHEDNKCTDGQIHPVQMEPGMAEGAIEYFFIQQRRHHGKHQTGYRDQLFIHFDHSPPFCPSLLDREFCTSICSYGYHVIVIGSLVIDFKNAWHDACNSLN